MGDPVIDPNEIRASLQHVQNDIAQLEQSLPSQTGWIHERQLERIVELSAVVEKLRSRLIELEAKKPLLEYKTPEIYPARTSIAPFAKWFLIVFVLVFLGILFFCGNLFFFIRGIGGLDDH